MIQVKVSFQTTGIPSSFPRDSDLADSQLPLTLAKSGYPGFEYNCEAVIFAHQILFIEPSNLPTNEEEVLWRGGNALDGFPWEMAWFYHLSP